MRRSNHVVSGSVGSGWRGWCFPFFKLCIKLWKFGGTWRVWGDAWGLVYRALLHSASLPQARLPTNSSVWILWSRLFRPHGATWILALKLLRALFCLQNFWKDFLPSTWGQDEHIFLVFLFQWGVSLAPPFAVGWAFWDLQSLPELLSLPGAWPGLWASSPPRKLPWGI